MFKCRTSGGQQSADLLQDGGFYKGSGGTAHTQTGVFIVHIEHDHVEQTITCGGKK